VYTVRPTFSLFDICICLFQKVGPNLKYSEFILFCFFYYLPLLLPLFMFGVVSFFVFLLIIYFRFYCFIFDDPFSTLLISVCNSSICDSIITVSSVFLSHSFNINPSVFISFSGLFCKSVTSRLTSFSGKFCKSALIFTPPSGILNQLLQASKVVKLLLQNWKKLFYKKDHLLFLLYACVFWILFLIYKLLYLSMSTRYILNI